MTTVNDLLTESFELAGIQSPTTAQVSSAFNSLNNMLSMYGVEELAYCVTTEYFTVTAGTASYTIGSSGNFNTVRPIRVANCFLRDSDDKDYPVSVMSAKDYNRLYDKSYTGRPTQLYFLPEYPLAKIIFNKAPDAAYTGYFEFHKPVSEYSTTSSTFSSPPEYREFLIYNTAVKIAEKWDRILQKTVYARADETKDEISKLNAVYRGVPETRFPVIGGAFRRNILTDDLIEEE